MLISILLRGAVVLALALAAARVLRPASASLRHALLAFALAAVLALPAIAALVPTWHTGAIANAPAELVPAQIPVAEPAPVGAAAIEVPAAVPARSIPWSSLLVALWLTGAALCLSRVGIGAVRARRLAARGTRAIGTGADSVWRALGGRGEPPRVVFSDDVGAPIVVGAIAPVVVVPHAASRWSLERWHVVLLHELAHVRRRDGLANLVAQLACSLYWIDPLAWLAARHLRAERELAADDAVLRDGARASTYAEHLLAIATGATRELPAALAMADGAQLEARVTALLDGDRERAVLGMRRAIVLAGAVAMLAAVAACVSPESAPADPASTTSTSAAGGDAVLQAAAEAELDRAIAANHAAGAVAIVLDARTGSPLAIAARGNGDARAARVPGSTMKPFTIAAALDAGVVAADARVDCEHGVRAYGDKQLKDSSPHGVLDLGGIIAVSSNVCTAKIAEPLGDRLGEALRRYHFAAPAHVDTQSLQGASIAGGEGVPVSPLDLAAAYTSFANDGMYRGERVMSEPTAHAVLAMLERVVDDADGTGHAARIDGVRVAGKTGTAESSVAGRYYASFVGIVPADAPRFVVLVGVDGTDHSGGEVAAPSFARIASRALGR